LVRIGRSNDNDVVVYSAVVSRHHVEMALTETGWQINSVGANGTYVNQERIASVRAVDGMVLRLGSTGPKIQISLGPLAANLYGKTITAKKTPVSSTSDPAARVKTFLTEPKTATTHSDQADKDEDTTQFGS
jgi:pSer/pThr/pTyr-binding forkhead associated (FHA) protein